MAEIYWVLRPDVPKDSSTEMSCILRALDIAAGILDARGVTMPEHLVIEAGIVLGNHLINLYDGVLFHIF